MSLDIYLNSSTPITETCICSCCENEHKREYFPVLYRANITHNLGKMAEAARIYDCLWRPDENDLAKAKDIITILEDGLKYLLNHPKEMAKLSPSNRWGTYEGLVEIVTEYLAACKEYPEAKIEVCR